MVESEACSSFQDEPAGDGRWYFSRKEIEENSPSRRDGIDLKEENYLRKSYVVFLQELGIRLKLPQIAIATAILFCHRFFLRQSHAKNDRWIIARACMFLAGKVECAPRSLKDLIQVSYAIIHRKDPAAAEKIKQEELIDQEAKLILFGERVVLATLDFDLNVHHPYRPLIEALLKFDIHRKEIGLVAWNYITTGLQTSLCLQYEPHVIAAAAIYRAAKFLNVDNITSDGEVWWCEFNITSQLLEEVVNQMMEHYENNPMPLSSDSGALSSHGFTTEPEESDAESGYYQASSAPNVWGSSVSSSQPVFSHSSADNLGGPQIQRNQQAALMEFLENADHRRIYNEIMEDMERITEDFNKASFNLELEDWMHGISLSDTFKPEYTDHDENDGGNVESSVGEVLSIMQADSENSVKEEEVFSSSVNDTKEKQSQQEEGTSSSG